MEVIFKIGLVLMLVFLNGYFVASEFALVASRRTKINILARKKRRNAKKLQKALKHLDTYISSTQLGITLASLALGWVGEPVIAHFLEPYFAFLPDLLAGVSAHTVAIIVAFAIITFLHIVLGELAPKTLALQRPELTSLVIITPLIIFTKIFSPFIWLLNGSGRLVLRLIGVDSANTPTSVYSEEEIRMLLAQSADEGSIPSKEVEMVNNVFQLGDTPVKYIMIPRGNVVAFNISNTLQEVLKHTENHPHSRFPVYQNTQDTVIGFIHIKDIYKASLKRNKNTRISRLDVIRPIISILENEKIDHVLSEMRKKSIHIAVVEDEFGVTSGIITLEDIIESLIGEITDEFEIPIKTITRQKDGTYLIHGNTPIEDVQERFALSLFGQGYSTIGGLIFGLLGHEPRIGDEVQIGKLRFEVEEVGGKRIKTVRLSVVRLVKTVKK